METNNVYEVEKECKHKLMRDKRIIEIVECDYCHAPISQNKHNKNGGYCDNCIKAMY